MKKIICMVLLFTALFTITACGNSKEEQNPDVELTEAKELEPETEAVPSGKVETEAVSSSEVETELQSTETAGENVEQENTAQENAEQGVTEMKMKVQVGDTVFTATLAENSSVDALKEMMAEGPLTLNMSDYANMEKGADLGVTLPQNNEQMNTRAGDIILYQGRTFVIYYDTNSWSLTPIAKIDNVDAEELRETLGTGDVTVILSLE